MRKNHIASKLLAAAIALAIAIPIGMPGSDALAQTAQGTAQGTPQGASPQVPQPEEGGVNWEGVGYGVGTVAVDAVYLPAKLVYAILGGVVGGGAYALTGGNEQTANTIWRSSLGGDYVVTPDMLAGKEPIHFSGPTDTSPPSTGNVQPITPPSSPAASFSTPAPQAASSPVVTAPSGGAQPMDSGSGPVNRRPATLPDTSIE